MSLDVDKSDPVRVCHDDIKSILQVLDKKKVELRQRTSEWWAVFIRVGLFTGMRRSELLGLRWSHVDFRMKSVKVAKEISKSRRDRTYESANQLCELLAVWRDSHPVKPKSVDAVLPYDKNSRGLYRDWEAILDAANITDERRFTFHDLRSTCVSEMLESGVALPTVSAWVGHQSIGVTAVHYAETRSAKRKVAEDRDIA